MGSKPMWCLGRKRPFTAQTSPLDGQFFQFRAGPIKHYEAGTFKIRLPNQKKQRIRTWWVPWGLAEYRQKLTSLLEVATSALAGASD